MKYIFTAVLLIVSSSTLAKAKLPTVLKEEITDNKIHRIYEYKACDKMKIKSSSGEAFEVDKTTFPCIKQYKEISSSSPGVLAINDSASCSPVKVSPYSSSVELACRRTRKLWKRSFKVMGNQVHEYWISSDMKQNN